ncbi:MAG: hydroxysqualene dehydroxylase HpnE [Sideroxydans sp.]|jgi:squalene-associated FAD-dependent desaturase
MAQQLSVGVIGGGYAGMAAAAELTSRGINVTVFESAKQLGGRARGVLHNDTQLDNGQHLLLGCYRETLRLIELVGGNIENDFLCLPLQLDLHGQFSLKAPRLPAPLHLLVALLNAQGLTWSERMKAAGFMLKLQGLKFKLEQDKTVKQLLAEFGQDADLTLKLWEPLCIAALNTPIHKASAQVLLNVLHDALNRKRADSDMLLPRIDFTALLPQRAADYVEQHGGKVHLSCGVGTIACKEDGIELVTAEGTHTFSHVICAAPPSVAAKLLCTIPEMARTVSQIEALEQQPIYTVYLQYPLHVRLPHPMIGLHQRFSQWLFDKGQIAAQHGLLAAVISAEGIHQDLSQEALAEKVIVELREEFGIVAQPDWFKVIAEKRATFCCSPDLDRPTQRTAIPNLLLAGDYTAGDYPATLEGAVLSGLRCAALCLPARK